MRFVSVSIVLAVSIPRAVIAAIGAAKANAKYAKESDDLKKAYGEGYLTDVQHKAALTAIEKQHAADIKKANEDSSKAVQSVWQNALGNGDALDKFETINDAAQKGIVSSWQVAATAIAATFTSAMSSVSNLMKSLFAAQEDAADKKYAHLTAAEQAYQSYQTSQDAIAYSHMSASEKKAADLKNASTTAEKARQRSLALEKTKLQREEAIFTKGTGITEATINTALGVARAFKDFPMPFAAAIAGLVGALGAAQVAAIAATPLPTTALAAGGVTTGANSNVTIGEAGQEIVMPLTSNYGQTAIGLLADKLLTSIQNKVNNTSNNVLPYQSSVQSNRAASLNGASDSGSSQPVNITLNGEVLGQALFKMSKQGQLMMAASSVVSVS